MTSRKPRKKAADATVRLVGYVRVSTDEQANEGVSLDAQRERLTAYCIAQGAELVAIEIDAGISGKVKPDQRPGLARCLEAVRNDKADGLVVLKIDRLSRSTRDILDLMDESRKVGWRLVSVSESLDTGSASGRMMVTMLAAMSEMERDQTVERTHFALDAIAREGRGRSRFTPYGWRTTDGKTENRAGDRSKLEPHKAEQAALKRIIRQREQGKGARRIAAALGRQGPNPRSGNPWTPESVAAILRRLDRWDAAGVDPLAA